MSSSVASTGPEVEAKPAGSLRMAGSTPDDLSVDSTAAPGADGVAIEVEDVGKCYHIYDKPSDRLKQALLLHKKQYYREFWAVRGVSFRVDRGESVGVVGRNGSGKSTLLQMIAGVLAPTTGSVRLRGRVGAMLELGSSFNAEFTGRENVYLSGSVLGVTRREMNERFDEIAAFADIGDFIEQPVKTYSSGMRARLAFAVNSMVEPDVLIVDEILSVGDIGFQQKCAARLKRLRDDGLTLLYVAHSPDSVRSLCQKALLLVDGRMVAYGPSDRVMNEYLRRTREQTNAMLLEKERESAKPVAVARELPGSMRYGSGHVQIEEVEVLDSAAEPRRSFSFGEPIRIRATIRAHTDAEDLSVSFLVRDQTGVDLMGTTSFDERVELPRLERGRAMAVSIDLENRLRAGSFGISLAVHRVSSRDYSDNILYDQIDGCVAFEVQRNPDRRVHYKYHAPASFSWEMMGDD